MQPSIYAPQHSSSDLPEFTGRLLASSPPSAVTLYGEGATIYAQGDQVGPLYFIEFGAVRVFRITYDGRRQISAFHFAGEVFGLEAGSEHGVSAESISRAGIRVLRPFSSAGTTQAVLQLALKSLEGVHEHLQVLGRQNAMEKVASFIVDLNRRQGEAGVVYLPMQRADIADFLGLTIETVSRILRKLIDAHIIRLPSTKEIQILKTHVLVDLSR